MPYSRGADAEVQNVCPKVCVFKVCFKFILIICYIDTSRPTGLCDFSWSFEGGQVVCMTGSHNLYLKHFIPSS